MELLDLRLLPQEWTRLEYDDGSWPQRFPLRGGYHDHATFNDNTINSCIATLLHVWDQRGDSRCYQAALRGGEFMVQSQLAERKARREAGMVEDPDADEGGVGPSGVTETGAAYHEIHIVLAQGTPRHHRLGR